MRDVLLYNPKAVFYTLPLGFLAVGSALDRERFQPRIVDGRLDEAPVGTLSAAAAQALCLGVGVLTGAPIRDALQVSRAMKRRHPHLPIVWGGWHPSLFPNEVLAESAVDAVVCGQGEASFRQIVECWAALGERVFAQARPVRNGTGAARTMSEVSADQMSKIEGIAFRTSSGEMRVNRAPCSDRLQ